MIKFLSSKLPPIPRTPAILKTIGFPINSIQFSLSMRLASAISAKSFASSFYDVYLSTSASLEMICRITLTEFLFNVFITFLILVRIYILYIYVVRGQCLFLKLTPLYAILR